MELVKNELQFYSKFARPLIFQLPDAKDRVLAAGWVKKIRDEQAGSEKLRTDYIKLLLFALQRQKLVGIFAEEPEHYERLEEFPADFDLNGMAKNLLKKEQFERVDRIRRQLRGQIGDSPPYMTDCSSDFREYVAAQDIPGFGVHCYYAISKDPIDTWNKADKGIFPKMAKSAVDTSSSVPPGVGGKSSDICVCPPAPEEADSSCKARVHREEPKRKKKKRQKNLGKSPPSHLLGHAGSPKDREPPSWSSNLMEVRDTGGAAGEIAPARSTGAIPKKKLDKKLKVPVKPDDSLYADDLKDIEGALEDYQRGKIKAVRQKKHSQQKKDVAKEAEADVPSMQDVDVAPAPLDDNYDDIERSQYQDEVDKDSRLLRYFKGKAAQSGIKQRITGRSKQVNKSAPAKSGIPLTTPRPSALPKRQKSSEKLYEQEEHLPHLIEKHEKGHQKNQPLGPKDPNVFELYEEASVLASKEDEEEDKEFQQLEEFFSGDGRQPAASGERDDDFEYQQLLEKQKQQEQSLFEEPPAPFQKGSPQANAIFSEAMDALQGDSPLGLPDDWFEQVNTGADGFLQGDYTFPEEFGAHGLPEVISIQPNISPYKPYKPVRKPAQHLSDKQEPTHREVAPQSPRGDFLTPSPLARPTSPFSGRTPPDQIGTQSPIDSLGYTTPEHLRIPEHLKTELAARRVTPQVRMAPKIRPQRSPSPAQVPYRSPQAPYRSPHAPSRSPRDMQLSVGDEQDAFFFDMAMEQPPLYSSPQPSPDRPNILTVQEAPPNQAILSEISPRNFFQAEPLGEADMADIWEGASAGDIFDDDIPALEEGVDHSEMDPEDFVMDDNFVPTFKHMLKKRDPLTDEDRGDVGYSLASTIRSMEPRTTITRQRPPPDQKEFKVPQREISENEQRYIDYLFPEDQEMNQLLKRVSGMVADVEQDFPDPYHLMPPSPELPDVESQDLFHEQSPGLDYYASPEPSPVAEPPPTGIQAPSVKSAISLTKKQIPRPSGIRPPGSRGIPVPKGSIPKRTGGIPRSAGAAGPAGALPRLAGAAGPAGALPRPAGAGPILAGAGPIPSGAGPTPVQPSQARPAAARKPIHAKGPLYFPQTRVSSDDWPPMSLAFQKDMRHHQIDEDVLDVDRQRMRSRQVLIGPSASRRHDTWKQFRPRETIQEDPDEPDLTPKKYGPCSDVGTPCADTAMPPRMSPQEPAAPPSFEDMLASYVPPMYVPPGEGFIDASPPFVEVEEDRELKRELLYDESREPEPLDMKHFKRMQEKRHKMNEDLFAEIEDLVNAPFEPPEPRQRVRQKTPSPERPALSSPVQPYIESPVRSPIQLQRRHGRRPTRITKGLKPRRLDFDQRDPDEVTETGQYIEEKLAQHKFALSPPEPASQSPVQHGILDERIPREVRLPAPISASVDVPGWRTPPWLSRRPKPPAVMQVKLPPVDPNQWFFQTEGEPQYATSPPELPEYDLGTPELAQGGGQKGGMFFDEDDELSPLPDLGASPEFAMAPCGGPVCSPAGFGPPLRSQREITPPQRAPPQRTPPQRTPQQRTPPHKTPPQGTPPQRFFPQITPSQRTPQRILSPATPSDGVGSPLGPISGHLFTPSPDAHMKTPVTSARRIFRDAGVRDSPVRYSPLSDPAAMEEMIQRVGEAEGRRGIRVLREQAALPVQQRPPPQRAQPKTPIHQMLRDRWIEEEDLFRDPEPSASRQKRRPCMSRIREDKTPPRPTRVPRAPPLPRPPQPPPSSPPDPYGLPPLLTFGGLPTPPKKYQRPSEHPGQLGRTKMPQGAKQLPRTRLDFDSPQQDENEQFIQEVLARQNLPPLSPQGPISYPSPPSWDPNQLQETEKYDLQMPQVGDGRFFDQTELSPLPDLGASPDLHTPQRLYPPLIQVTSPSPRTPDWGPSHGITMATCGSPRGYMPDSFMEESQYRTPSPGPSHGITMATCGSPRGYMPDSFLGGSPEVSPAFMPSPGDDFRTPEGPVTARNLFGDVGMQESPKQMPTPSPPMQQMISQVSQAPGRSGVRTIREQRSGGQATPQSLREQLRATRLKEQDDLGPLPREMIVRKRPGPPSMPTLMEQTPPFDQYGLPAIEKGICPARTDAYYSPPSQPSALRSRREILPEEPGMQRAIDNLREGRPMDLDAIQVAASPVQQVPRSPCSSETIPGYRTPEHLRIRKQTPPGQQLQRVLPPSRHRTPPQRAPPEQAYPSYGIMDEAFRGQEDDRRMSPRLDRGFLMEESPQFDYPQSPQQDRSPEHFTAPGTSGALLFDQQIEEPYFASPPPLGTPPHSRSPLHSRSPPQLRSPPHSGSISQQDQFGLPGLVQLPSPKQIDFTPVRPMMAPTRIQRRSPSPCSPNVEDHVPIFPPHETSFESPEYAGGLKFSSCRGAMIEPLQDTQLDMQDSPEKSPGHWQRMTNASPEGALMDVSPGILEGSPRSSSGSPRSSSGSPSPDRVVSHSMSNKRIITSRRLDF